MRIKLLIALLFVSFVVTGCGDDYDDFMDKAAGFAKSNGAIDTKELELLKEEVALYSTDRKFQKLCTSGKPDEVKLIKVLKAKGFKLKLLPVIDHNKDTVNLYIENSGSMFGYVNGDTQYKDALTELLVQLGSKYGKQNIRLHFINTKIYPIAFEGNPAQYPGTLNPNVFKSVGDINSSDINDIYRQIIEKTDAKTVSLLVSDCIYSVTGDDIARKLEIQKSLTKDAFHGHDNLAATIVKLNAAFNGTYYTKNKTRANCVNNLRPYYITVLGTADALSHFNSNINLKPLNGYENKFTVVPGNPDVEPYYTVVNTANSSGFRPIRDLSGAGFIHGIEDVEVNERNGKRFTFSVAMDLSEIPAEDNVKVLASGYSADGYDISITPYNPGELKPSSVQQISKSGYRPTHLITFTAKADKFTDAKLALKKAIPGWVYKTSTNDDTNLKSGDGKTFGFKYLVEGINEAARDKADSDNYFNITIKINQ